MLYLYLVVSDKALSAVLVKQEDKVQKPIYYVSKVLYGAELNYSTIEKFTLAMIIASRKLRPYFRAHAIEVLTNQPLKNVIHSPRASGRLIKWAIKLGEFDIKYKPRLAVKAQALADFLVECTIDNQEVEGKEDIDKAVMDGKKIKMTLKEYWTLYFDGASKTKSSGAGLVLQSPEGFTFEFALKLDFPTTNNGAKYKALIAGLGLAKALRAKNVKICGDSRLVISQVNGEYEARDEIMMKDLVKVRAMRTHFEECTMEHIPREKNIKADALSQFASSEAETYTRNVYFELLKASSINAKLVAPVTQETCWMDPIKAHLESGRLPNETMEARKLHVRALRYALIDGALYKKSYLIS